MSSPRRKCRIPTKAVLGNCFVLMPFKPDLNEFYNQSIKPTVERTGIIECLRADDIYGPGPIITDIWQSIRESKLLIADLTGRNPNVLYELGLAHAIQKPVILLTQNIDDVPFDLRHLRVITYENTEKGRKLLIPELYKTLKKVVEEIEDKSLAQRYILLETSDESEVDEGEDPQYLLRQLGSNNPNEILKALSKIIDEFRYKEKPKNCDPSIIVKVLPHLKSPFLEVQSSAIRALKVAGDKIHGYYLHNFLLSDNPTLIEESIIALGELRDRSAICHLLNIFDNPKYQVYRDDILRALAKIGGKEAMSLFTKVVTDDEANTLEREIAIRSLGEMLESKAIDVLLNLDINNLNTSLRCELAEALAESLFIYPTHTRRLEELFNRLFLDRSVEVRGWALTAWCVQSFKDFNGVLDRSVLWDHLWKENEDALLSFFMKLDEFKTPFSPEESNDLVKLAEKHPRIKGYIISCLSDIGDSSVSDFMIRAFNESEENQRWILDYLSRVPSRDAVELLHDEIQNSEDSSRISLAAMALLKLGEEDTIDLLLENVFNSYEWIQIKVRRHLQEYLEQGEFVKRRKEISQVIEKLTKR